MRQADRVLFRGDQLGPEGGGIAFQAGQKGIGQRLMVGEGFGVADIGAELTQGGKDLFRVGDAGEGQHVQALPVHPCLQRGKAARQMRQRDGVLPGGREGILGLGVADREQQVGAGEAGGDGFAQGARGQAAAIAEAAGGIDHHE